MPAVPLIDFSPFRTGAAASKQQVAEAIGRACEETGFLVVEGHGVPQASIEAAFAAGRDFFALSTEEKQRAAPPTPLVPRGYHAHASKSLARTLGVETPPDLREQFYLGPLDDHAADFAHIPGASEFYRPNIWPERPAEYRPVFTRLYRAMERLARELMRAFALALGREETFFDGRIDRHFSTCALNHYPAPSQPALPGQLRAGAHTDFGSLTILLLDDAPGGLQIEAAPGEWRDVRPAPGQAVVNLGDMMARWTGDRWRSTLHRVVTPSEADAARSRRQSIAFFLHPNYDAEVASLVPGPAKYPPIRAGDHMRMKMERRIG
jgi:isopenicillin N synthase-like dioxygenase